MKDRLTELEIKINPAEDMVEELNRTVYRQQEQIDLLQAQLQVLYGQLQTNAEPAEPRNRAGRDSAALLIFESFAIADVFCKSEPRDHRNCDGLSANPLLPGS